MEPTKIISYISRHNGPPRGWAAVATREEAENHQKILGGNAAGIEPSEHTVPGVRWSEGAGYFQPDGTPTPKPIVPLGEEW